MKKWLLGVFVVLLTFNVCAEEKAENNEFFYRDLLKTRLSVPDTRTYFLSLRERLTKMQSMTDEELEKVKNDDFWEKRVKKIPKKYWEYYIPSLFYNKAVPESFLNRPDIKKYKNRLPRNIAPEVAEVVKKYGKDISPDYYYLLMPETYEKMNASLRQDKEHSPKPSGNFELKVYRDKSEKKSAESLVSPYIQSKMALIDANMDFINGKLDMRRSSKISEKGLMTNADVSDFIKSVTAIRRVLETEKNAEKMMKVATVRGEKENVCSFFERRLRDAGVFGEAEKVMSDFQFDPVSWQNACQRILKVSAFMNLNLGQVQNIHVYSKLAGILKKDISIYAVNIDDYKALAPYANQLYEALKGDRFILDYQRYRKGNKK